jgi:hypothetical protein
LVAMEAGKLRLKARKARAAAGGAKKAAPKKK